jgi:hypothetical protein
MIDTGIDELKKREHDEVLIHDLYDMYTIQKLNKKITLKSDFSFLQKFKNSYYCL